MDILLALLPTLLLLLFFYFRDKYEKEPLYILRRAFIYGVLIIVPVLIIEWVLSSLPVNGAFYDAFIVAAFTEESIKFCAVFLLLYHSKEFNEQYDGIIYSVYLSLGFATVENIFYVIEGGTSVAVLRLFTAVPAHALFGTFMGYYLGKYKFSPQKKPKLILSALFVPILFHGLYNFLIMSKFTLLLLLFIPLIIYLWIRGLKNTKELIEKSPFK
jgi:RsiW-degrading membrane proteinase PrsW (M82 family)